jgi:hypothetical protein
MIYLVAPDLVPVLAEDVFAGRTWLVEHVIG